MGLTYIHFETASGDNLRSLILPILETYKILEKIRVCVTDSGSNMISACDGLPFIRLPCICHVLNVLMSSFIKSGMNIFSHIFNIQREMNTPKFITFLINKNSIRRSIPYYSQVRWYSLAELIHALMELRELIIDFRILEKMIPIQSSIWATILELSPFFESYKQIIKMLESDDFGTVSYN